MKNTRAIALFNIFGIVLLTWYGLTQYQGFWFRLDSSIFHFFNQLIGTNTSFAHFISVINNRLFDVIVFLTMCVVYFCYYRKQDATGKRKMIAIGILMLVCTIAMKQSFGRLLPIEHASPTLYFDQVFHAGDISGIPTKDTSNDSFPSDHGMFLMIFSAFMLYYFGKKTLLVTLPMIMLFSLPRIMIGAHWFSDIYVGSLGCACIALSWLLLTPVSDYLVKKLMCIIPNYWGKNASTH